MIDLYAIIKERVPQDVLTWREWGRSKYLYSVFELKRKKDGELRWQEYLVDISRFTTLEAAQEKYPHAIYIGESDEWLSSYPFKEEHLGETS